MLSRQFLINVVSGNERGIGPALLRFALWILALPYAAAAQIKNWIYDWRIKSPAEVNVPVISVGNLTTGGTGKTPMIYWLLDHLQAGRSNISVISRGYKSLKSGENDEARELAERYPRVSMVLNKDRVAGARTAVNQYQAELLILDDGFQHRRLARDVDIVLVDSMNPFGYRHLLPRGLLRESAAGLRRASAIVLTRCDQIEDRELQSLRQSIQKLAPGVPCIAATTCVVGCLDRKRQQYPLTELAGYRLLAFCGVGNPSSFFELLRTQQIELASKVEFPDHHHYGNADWQLLLESAAKIEATALICTRKDLVKLDASCFEAGLPLFALEIAMSINDADTRVLEQVLANNGVSLRNE